MTPDLPTYLSPPVLVAAEQDDVGAVFLRHAAALLTHLAADQRDVITAAAAALADTIVAGGVLHVFGTGHSHIVAEELFYRAGGLVAVRPVLMDSLMLHVDAELSTHLERLPGLGSAVLARAGVVTHDTVLVVSNSGGNATVREFAEGAQATGATVIAITSLAHATSGTARHSTGPRLHQIADIVLDNGGVPGDAAFVIAGFDVPIGPTSTVVATALANAIVVSAIQQSVQRGVHPEVYRSANTTIGEDHNTGLAEPGTAATLPVRPPPAAAS
jgi:uncharacterized phosphosugar-binding protein